MKKTKDFTRKTKKGEIRIKEPISIKQYLFGYIYCIAVILFALAIGIKFLPGNNWFYCSFVLTAIGVGGISTLVNTIKSDNDYKDLLAKYENVKEELEQGCEIDVPDFSSVDEYREALANEHASYIGSLEEIKDLNMKLEEKNEIIEYNCDEIRNLKNKITLFEPAFTAIARNKLTKEFLSLIKNQVEEDSSFYDVFSTEEYLKGEIYADLIDENAPYFIGKVNNREKTPFFSKNGAFKEIRTDIKDKILNKKRKSKKSDGAPILQRINKKVEMEAK